MFDRGRDNILKKLEKHKSFKKMNVFEYQNFICWLNTSDKRKYWIKSEHRMKADMRAEFVAILHSINYKRKEHNWTPQIVAAFIHEVIGIQDLENEPLEKAKAEISGRYNIEPSKLNSTVSFFMGLKRNTYSLKLYFTDYDFLAWQYRNAKTLNKALENDTLFDKDKEMLKELGLLK